MAVWSLALILIDQGLKWYLGKNYAHLVVANKGLFFGLINLPDHWTWIVLIAIAFLMMFLIYQDSGKAPAWPLWLIVAGVLSNLIDRVFRGSVIDYINFKGLPATNLADIFIVVGAIFYAYYLIKNR